MIEGEQYFSYWAARLKSDPKAKPNYFEMLPLDRVRAQYQPYAWGPQTLFLPENWTWRSLKPEWMDLNHPEMRTGWEHISAMMLLHDTIYWYACSPQVPLWPNLVTWGWDDQVVTHPYWRSQQLVKLSTDAAKPVVATVFLRPKKALVLLFNDTDQAETVTLTLNPQALGLPKGIGPEVSDLMRNKRFNLTDATHLTVTVPPRNARFLALAAKEESPVKN